MQAKSKAIQIYYNTNRDSQSSLKDLDYSPAYYKAKHIDKTIVSETFDADHFLIGSLADSILLTPECTEDLFAVRTFDSSPQVKKLVSYLIKEGADYSSYDILFDIAKHLKLFGQIKNIDTFKSTLEKENFEEAITFFEKNIDKTIVSKEHYEKAVEISHALLTSPFTANYLRESDGVEILTAHPIYWYYKDLPFKSLLDHVSINHNTKKITINDVKTTRFNTSEFKNSILDYRYDIQGSFYLKAFEWWIENTRKDLADYTVDSFNFLVASVKYNDCPLIYRMTTSDYFIGQIGAKLSYNGMRKHYRGFDNIIDDLIWHKKTNIWYAKKEYYENKGIIDINIATD